MIDIDGVVGGLVQLVQDAYLPPCYGRCGEHRHAELVLVHGLRTTEGEEYATGLYLLECLLVDFGISLEGMTQSVLVLGKGRRVEDDEVVFIPHFIEELESIGGKGLVAGVAGEVERDIGIDEFQSLGTAIHGM